MLKLCLKSFFNGLLLKFIICPTSYIEYPEEKVTFYWWLNIGYAAVYDYSNILRDIWSKFFNAIVGTLSLLYFKNLLSDYTWFVLALFTANKLLGITSFVSVGPKQSSFSFFLICCPILLLDTKLWPWGGGTCSGNFEHISWVSQVTALARSWIISHFPFCVLQSMIQDFCCSTDMLIFFV